MRVLMITPEVTPFAQTGGLGEVLSSLPAALVSLGAEVDVLMPKYRRITQERFDIEKTNLRVEVDLNANTVSAGFWRLRNSGGPRVFFLECDEYYDRDDLYGDEDGDYKDNAERFVFLARSAIEMALVEDIHYDVFHSHDWQSALAPVYIRTLYAGLPLLAKSASVMTIHNLGYQGIFWHWDMPLIGVGWEYFNPRFMEFHGHVSLLKSGIVFADKVNTVSRGYCEEILTPEFGFGLEGVLQEKGSDLKGILNGVDYEIWDPHKDPMIAAGYSPGDLSGKAACKAELQVRAGLPTEPKTPLIAMVSRLSSQKGIDLVEAVIPALAAQGVQFVLLGTGEDRYQYSFRKLAQDYSENTGIFLSYDYELAHKIFAGADMVLVPSRYEPCGLNQMYAMKYGAIPIVRATGGLRDTVDQFDPDRETGAGFKFDDPEPSALKETILKALDLYRTNPVAWQNLMVRAMKQDFSWERSAREYLRLYEQAVENRARMLRDSV